MAKRRHPSNIARRHYSALARSPLHSLVFVVPLLAFYHIGSAASHADPLHAPLMLCYMQQVFERLGSTASLLPPAAVVLVLLAQHFAHRDRLAVYPSVLGCMLLESAIWMLPMIAMLHIAGMLDVAGMLTTQAGMPDTEFGRVLVGVGAGIYEEFVFRLVSIGLIMLVLVDVLSLPKNIVAVAAILVTAVGFGLYHPTVWASEGFQWWLLLFYTFAGAYLGVLYVRRGFAIVVGAHCLFNIYKVFV